MKTDCRNYGEHELTMWFMNEEYLYNSLQNAFRTGLSFDQFVKYYVDESFLYYAEQLFDLEEYYDESLVEYENGQF